MIEVEINQDIRDYKTKLIGPFTTRQVICLVLGGGTVIGAYNDRMYDICYSIYFNEWNIRTTWNENGRFSKSIFCFTGIITNGSEI